MKSDTKKHHILKTIPDSGSSGCLSEGQTAFSSFSVRVRRIRYFSGNVRLNPKFFRPRPLNPRKIPQVHLSPREKFRRSTSYPPQISASGSHLPHLSRFFIFPLPFSPRPMMTAAFSVRILYLTPDITRKIHFSKNRYHSTQKLTIVSFQDKNQLYIFQTPFTYVCRPAPVIPRSGSPGNPGDLRQTPAVVSGKSDLPLRQTKKKASVNATD